VSDPAPAHGPPLHDPTADDVAQVVAETRTVAQARARRARGSSDADRRSAAVLGGGYILLSLVMLLQWRDPTWRDVAAGAAIAVVHGLASRVTFESTAGSAVPTEPILIAALFLVPLPLVPMVVLVGMAIGSDHDNRSGVLHGLYLRSLNGWHSVGPVLVLAASGDAPASLDRWPWYLLALLAQFTGDALVAVVRVRSLGVSWRVLPKPMAWTCAVDTMLASAGLTAVIATPSMWALLPVCAPIGLLALLARDRAEHLEKAVVISEAFEEAVELARIDPLTKAGNRRAWNEAVSQAALRFAADPERNPVIVLMADLDGLKRANDTFGHDVGDELIRAAADAFRQAAPTGALVARLGGDEFGVLLVGSSQSAADLVIAVQQAVRDQPPVSAAQVQLSLSVGAAACPPFDDVEAAVTAADELAFADKTARRAGRS
jgi:diguanylate cyclase (GGDEF)-like protein